MFQTTFMFGWVKDWMSPISINLQLYLTSKPWFWLLKDVWVHFKIYNIKPNHKQFKTGYSGRINAKTILSLGVLHASWAYPPESLTRAWTIPSARTFRHEMNHGPTSLIDAPGTQKILGTSLVYICVHLGQPRPIDWEPRALMNGVPVFEYGGF